MLFNGTGGADPIYIYTGEEGFDKRKDKGTMWGRAIYFSVNSSYSHSFSFSAPGGGHQIFMADVLLGTYETLAPNSNIRIPNLIPGR